MPVVLFLRNITTSVIFMTNLSIGRQTIRHTGTILILFGIISLSISIGSTTFDFINYHAFNLEATPLLLLIIPGLLLRKNGYLTARRVAFLVGLLMVSNLKTVLISIYQLLQAHQLPQQFATFNQLTLNQVLPILSHNYYSLIMSLIFLVITLCLEIWVYRKLTSKTVISEATKATIPYKPFWRYSPARSFILAFIVCFIMNPVIPDDPISTDGITQNAVKLIQENVRKQYGPTSYIFISHLNVVKSNNSGKTEIDASGTVYDGKTFLRRNFHLSNSR